jgi:hypothetical protein
MVCKDWTEREEKASIFGLVIFLQVACLLLLL